MFINFYTAQFYPIYDLFAYFCSILEIEVLYLVLFSIILINITYFNIYSNIVQGIKKGLGAILIGGAAAAGKDFYDTGKKVIIDAIENAENKKPNTNTGDSSSSNNTGDNSSSNNNPKK